MSTIEHPPEQPTQEFPARPSEFEPSLLDELRELRENAVKAQEDFLVSDVPRYENRLAVIYRFPEQGGERAMQAARRERQTDSFVGEVEANASLLVACCAAVVLRNEKGELTDPLTGEQLGPDEKPELPPDPLRFDRRLAETFKIAIPEDVKGVGRFVCRNLFSPKGQSEGKYEGDLALINTANGVYAWLNGVLVRADESAEGE